MIPASRQIGIGITTRDRWEDLATTLRHLQDEGLDAMETLVIDDGSEFALPSRFASEFPWVKFMRFDTSLGIPARRNQLAQLLSSPLLLSLDDDSFPVAGNFDAAATWLLEQSSACALAFTVIFPGEPIPPSVEVKPYPVASFYGCGHLLKRELFLTLGGYDERLGAYGAEEPEFCLKAFQQGYDTRAFPGVVIRHEFTARGRNQGFQVRQTYRNKVLVGLWYLPFPVSWLRAARVGPIEIVRDSNTRKIWRDVLVGSLQGAWIYLKGGHKKRRLSRAQFARWSGFPSGVR
jgi:GT2 family glycosyltransferase